MWDKNCVQSAYRSSKLPHPTLLQSARRSDYSRMSSTSSELSVEDAQDPFLVSIHIITDPGESQTLQEAIDKLLAWLHPDLQLFLVSERRVPRKRKKPGKVSQPALAVILFLQEEYGEEQILQFHESFRKPPWHYHHTERVPGRFLPYLPCSQDFFVLTPGTPLWAIRPVHYGKEIIRFTIYCRYENFSDILKLYEVILKKGPSQRKSDFCIFPVYSNLDVDIQFSLKRLPKGHSPSPTESSVLEFRVKDLGQLVPLLPNPCSPISEGRWQTEDHDGNKILLQAQSLYRKSSQTSKHNCWSTNNFCLTASPSFAPQSPSLLSDSSSGSQQLNLGGPDSGLCQYFGIIPQQGLPDGAEGRYTGNSSNPSGPPWPLQRSKSLFCLPSLNSSFPRDSLPPTESLQFLNGGSPEDEVANWKANRRLFIDDLEDAQETDVDTGLMLSFSDLSVVSAYSAPGGFCDGSEAFALPPKRGIHRSKPSASRRKPPSAISGSAPEASCSSLPSLSTWPSSCPISTPAPPSVCGSPLSVGPRTILSGKPAVGNTYKPLGFPRTPSKEEEEKEEEEKEEEFYI
ncbi:protein FAM124A isoform X2 [Tachyglossus aculeatus]|uniref:protein FAM124A isoform X2 n=1 Tax=Tachyglossus aculeatus TaxID=9261 RepID=UPI0018F38FBB|nr:protein FAM124A isoform X2 [Tachyglossus aculeatus]